MSKKYTTTDVLNAIVSAYKVLDSRKEEINRLNVFPVPDGDTGTNMALTIKSVVDNIAMLPKKAGGNDIRRAITTGALMGARGNSGVITSQILRGFCEGSIGVDALNVKAIATGLETGVSVALQAVRKPVEGTILTVLRDATDASKEACKKKFEFDKALDFIVTAAYESVRRTPDLLPVLKENGVVDAGGLGLAILLDAFVAALLGRAEVQTDDRFDTQIVSPVGGQADEFTNTRAEEIMPKATIEQVDDWGDSQYRYCNEFLVDSDTLDVDEALEFLASVGDCELCVGASPNFKVHVHSNNPDKVLAYFLERGQISEVLIHNMQLQSANRIEKLASEQESRNTKPLGIVAVANGEGNAEILKSFGVDVVVSGGQTMNPSTKDLLDAISETNADEVIVLPDNSNVILAAQSACDLSGMPCKVVPTKSIPEAFSALFVFDSQASLDENVDAMCEAYEGVRTGEVTTAIKDSHDVHDNKIAQGDIIGIAEDEIKVVDSTVEGAVMGLLEAMGADDADILTLLAGQDYPEDDFDALVEDIGQTYDDLEINPHRGQQPLYPIIFSLE